MANQPLRILITADPELPVPPRLYGGIERIIALLVDGLVERGHDVTLVAHRDSAVTGRLVAYGGTHSRAWSETAANAVRITREVARVKPNVIQSFGRLAYLVPVLPFRIPKVMSYQREVTPRSIQLAMRLARGSLRFTGCSRRLIEPVQRLARWDVIYNAVPVARYRYTTTVDGEAPLVFLGRVELIKGAHLAIEVAAKAGRRLIIAGNVPEDPEHQRYFRERVQPFLDGNRITYIGPVDDQAKGTLLASAAALLMPVLWDEPFGIVMAEALACGTPVIGLRRGAVPEVVDDGITGFVRDTPDEMGDAVSQLPTLSRLACRNAAEERFSDRALVDAYEALYFDAVSTPRLAATTGRSSERPLPHAHAGRITDQ